MFYTQESFIANFGEVLLKSIDERCCELAVFIDRATIKDLHSIYPMLIDSIFGPLSRECWNLRGTCESNSSKAYNVMRQFLSPLGPIFKLICTLLKDPLVKFNFNLNYLPMKVRENTNPSTTHPFYMDMINVDLQTNQTVSLMLNPFDYYFFHFAYHLINPIHSYQSSDTIHWETVYFTLYCDYLRHFLPNDPSTKVLPNLNFYHGKNPYYTLPSLNKPAKVSKLLRAELFNVNTVESVQHHPRNEVWRSETVMTVFIDMWFGSDRVLNSSYNFDSSFSTSFKEMFQRSEMPSTEYIRIVRVLVKHLHAFANSAKADDTHLGDLKQIVLPCLQGKVYVLLRHLIYSWPLDGSFRLVLELWFSFIQPWRYLPDYLKVNQVDANIDNEDLNTSTSGVTREHMTFLGENLLAYTVLLQQLLPRFSKVDLASPKIALILYRTCKVFGQPHLISYLRDIEEAIQQVTVTSPIHPYHSPTSHGLPPLSPTSKWSTNASQSSNTHVHWNDTTNSAQTGAYGGSGGKWGNIVRQKIMEYEGSHFCYKPMFIPPVASEVLELISHIQNAQRVALNNVQMRVREKEQRGFFVSLISKLNINEYLHDDVNEEDRKKVPIYLDYSLKLLVEMFQITDNFTAQMSFESAPLKSFDGHLSNPRQLMARIKNIKYEGDPDLRPIQSHEVTALVRMFYQLSVKVNSKYGSEMRDWYNSNTWQGWFLRQILCPPLRIYRFDKSSPGAPKRVSEDLPPRISLRFLANFWSIFYSILLIFVTKFFGFSLLALFFIIFVVWCTYRFIKSVYEPYPNDINMDASSMSSGMSREFHNNESF